MKTFSLLADLLDSGYSLTAALRLIGEFETETIKITDLPTSDSGLTSGQIWSNSGVLTVVA